MAPVDLVGAGLEMARAEGCEAFDHRVDLEPGGEEGVEGLELSGARRVIGVRLADSHLSLGPGSLRPGGYQLNTHDFE